MKQKAELSLETLIAILIFLIGFIIAYLVYIQIFDVLK